MYKISLMGFSDLEEAYKIELDVNPSPWKYETFLSSLRLVIRVSSARMTTK